MRAVWATAVLCAMVLTGCRIDMHVQPRYNPLDQSTFFPDGKSARPAIPDTVARGHLRTNELFYTGKVGGQLVDAFPFPITRADLDRGRERFNIYCSPCHGLGGDGHGMIVQRGFSPPPSFHIERLRKAPAGHLFGVMNGFGRMYSYASRVNPQDRWRIVAYIRALQLSQSATLEDAPESARKQLQENPR
jgi:hypothetical protein